MKTTTIGYAYEFKGLTRASLAYELRDAAATTGGDDVLVGQFQILW